MNPMKTTKTEITLSEQTHSDLGFCAHAPGCSDIKRHQNDWNYLGDPYLTKFKAGMTLEEIAREIHFEGNADFISEWEDYDTDKSFEENARRYYDEGQGYEVHLFPCAVKHIKENMK